MEFFIPIIPEKGNEKDGVLIPERKTWGTKSYEGKQSVINNWKMMMNEDFLGQ